ncbi:winged helix-turn-helix domain-containing protein [Martelella sp. HB161492]|uniref:winged helix-turn-helix domain-containing protein n=1 Tax=Martelella sp. HB161492 TaxID=2720726 RepID=UPI001590BE31|nr:winged helix-turn-helix domain-containing protein [Martelella sp. HB161492]
MTTTGQRTLGSNAIFLTEAQIAARMGLSTSQLKAALPALTKSGFPTPDPLFLNRRYWPACEAFLNRRYGLIESAMQATPGLDGEETWN